MYTCGTCEHPVTFNHFGEPICDYCNARPKRRFWVGVAAALALLGIGIILWVVLDRSLHTHFAPNSNSYCAHVDRANRGNCE